MIHRLHATRGPRTRELFEAAARGSRAADGRLLCLRQTITSLLISVFVIGARTLPLEFDGAELDQL